MTLAELALALSARDWAERLHRFLADHGGARVRVNAFGPDDLVRESFDILLIDDSCSFLSPRLVADVHRLGRRIVGVYDPAEFADGKDRLRDAGVDDVIEAEAAPEEFLAVISRIAIELRGPTAADVPHQRQIAGPVERPVGPAMVVVGAGGGVGVTEVAISVSAWLASKRLDVLLIDADRHRPALAQRLGLDIHPNLLTVQDRIEQDRPPFDRMVQRTDPGFAVLPGAAAGRLGDSAVVRVVEEALAVFDAVVVDAGSAPGPSSAPGGGGMDGHTSTVVIGGASPVGLTRLIDTAAEMGSTNLDIVVNRVPHGRFRRAELAEELLRTQRPRSLGLLPQDEAVARAAWSGRAVEKGPFRKAVDRWLNQVW